MKIAPFATEHFFAQYEFSTPHQLCNSDCETVSVAELLDMAEMSFEDFGQLSLGYTESLGNPRLREAIAATYEGVDRDDVNPRPLSSVTPHPGLIGCFSADEEYMLALAWQPYQELFQGVIVCLHADFRLGGVAPGETKQVHGKLYLIPADAADLLRRYARDFPATDVGN